MPASGPPPASTPARFTALDMLRGLAVAGMIVVNSPGDWGHIYAQLDHAPWNGATAADMVFPAFLFSVGVALGWSFPRPLGRADERRRYWRRLIRRTAALVLLGLAIGAIAAIERQAMGHLPAGQSWIANLRLPGILQRIGLCYGLAGALLLVTARRDTEGVAAIGVRAVAVAIVAILIGYWLILTLVPVPGVDAGVLTPADNLPGYVDRAIFTQRHIWHLGSATGTGPPTYDPEGLLSTLPATANVLFGVLAAWAWKRAPDGAATRIAAVGGLLIVAGILLDPLVPLNKRLWTSSFVLLTSGVSALALALLAVVLRSPAADRALTPFRVLGGNAIVAFLVSTALSFLSVIPMIPDGDRRLTPQAWGYAQALALARDPRVASLLCALAILMVVTLLIWPLHRRAIHFRL